MYITHLTEIKNNSLLIWFNRNLFTRVSLKHSLVKNYFI